VINTYDALSLRITDAGAPLAGNPISDSGVGGRIKSGFFRNQSFSEAEIKRHTSRGWRRRYFMTIDEALTLINNLDMREPLRRYGPKWSTVFVGRHGEILGVHRHKESLEKQGDQVMQEDAQNYPTGTFFFTAMPGTYTTPEQLEGKLRDVIWGYEHEAEIEANPERRWLGKLW
jgi:hypothetical protein